MRRCNDHAGTVLSRPPIGAPFFDGVVVLDDRRLSAGDAVAGRATAS